MAGYSVTNALTFFRFQACVETLRQEDNYSGKIVLISAESDTPYDRPKLSKAMGAAASALRPTAFYNDADIELKLNHMVSKVDINSKEIKFEGGESSLNYDKLIIASGSSPRTLDVPGGEANNIFVLRTPSDGSAIVEHAKDGNVVILGTSFIGMEVASSLVGKAASVTVIGNSSVPFKRSLGETFGKFFMDLHESKGVRFEMGAGIKEFVVSSDSGKATEVILSNGNTLTADVVVLGIGVTPNSNFLDGSQIDLTDRGFVSVNEFMETSVDNVYAIGDIASFPLHIADGRSAAIGHWQLAHAHGRNAALNISGKKTPFKSVPFFWTMQFGKSVRYAGYAPDFDDIVVVGEPSEGAFAAYYTKGEDVLAIGTIGKDPLAADFANLLQSGGRLKKSEVKEDWKSKL